MDNNARLNDAYREGLKEGEERLLETARKLKQMGISALQISEATGLRTEEIEQL
jgi:predicted transposase YdaD